MVIDVNRGVFFFFFLSLDDWIDLRGGLEATSLIRKHEEEHHLERVPIIALTAHAM